MLKSKFTRGSLVFYTKRPMRKTNTSLLNPIFLAGLAVLILNDAWWKWSYHNALTGKLSDFAGLLILPAVLAVLLPKYARVMPLLAGLAFVYWKSPMSTGLIATWNGLGLWPLHRVVDYSDLWALAVLPASRRLIHDQRGSLRPVYAPGLLKALVLVAAVLAFGATSILRLQPPEGDIYIGKSYTIKLPKDSVLQRMTTLGIDWQYDTLASGRDTLSYYQANYLPLSNYDTLLNAKFYLHPKNEKKSELFLINVSLRKGLKVQDWKQLRWLSRYYEELVKEGLIEPLSQAQ